MPGAPRPKPPCRRDEPLAADTPVTGLLGGIAAPPGLYVGWMLAFSVWWLRVSDPIKRSATNGRANRIHRCAGNFAGCFGDADAFFALCVPG